MRRLVNSADSLSACPSTSFSERGLITEIRAYYACPTIPEPPQTHELGDVDYAARGFAMQPPKIER